MKTTFILLSIIFFPLTIFAEQDNNSSEVACTAVLCLYGEAEGVEAGEDCKLALEKYYSINQKSVRTSCEETKNLRKLFLNSCKENIYPVDNLVNCLF